jgi:valyl-tRNA synthetase
MILLLKEFHPPDLDCTGQLISIRDKIVQYLKRNNLLVKEEPYKIIRKACYRCNTNIEHTVSDQWYVKMRPIADKAKNIECNFYPEYQRTIYHNWLNNIHDWCISRQILYGHQIPVWYCNNCSHINCSEEDVLMCKQCFSNNLKKETDVLDTWSSSWLWASGVFNDDDIKKYFPLNVTVSGSDILFFWIACMIMASKEFYDQVPFKNIVLHGVVRDKNSIKMTKILGNVIYPLDVIEEFGTDTLRYSLISTSSID